MRRTFLIVLLIGVLLTPSGPALAVQARASAIAVTPDGSRIWVVNPDSNTVTAIDAVTESVLAEVPVGREPRTLAITPDGSKVYVACMGESRVDVITSATLSVAHTIAVGREPFGVAVAPNGARAYVTNSASDSVMAINTATDTVVLTGNAGDHPRGLAVSSDSSTIVVTRFLTVSPAPNGLNGTVAVMNANTLALLGTVQLATLGGPLPGVPNLIQFAAFRPGTNIFWIPMVGSQTGNANLTASTTVHPFLSLVDVTTRTEIGGGRTNLNQVIANPGVSHPVALDFTAAGDIVIVVNMASNDVTILSAATRAEIKTVLVGDAPQGVAINAAGTRAYVSNYLSRNVSVLSISPPASASVLSTIAVTLEPLPAHILNGKKIFFSARGRLSTENRVACISCHPDGSHDGRDWLFGNNVDEGQRVTTDIRGIMDSGAIHWTANMNELQDLEFNVRKIDFGAGILDTIPNDPFGPPNAGLSQDLDDFAAFMDSLVASVKGNPNRAPGGGMTASAQAGKAIFKDPAHRCASCHRGVALNDSDRVNVVRHDVGTISPTDINGQDGFDTPSLRNLYDSGPYLHDGTAPNLQAVIVQRNPNDRHGVTSNLTATQRNELVNFLLAIGTDRDEIAAGQGVGLPASIRLPVRCHDLAYTALDADDQRGHNHIQGYSFSLRFAPAGVQSVTVAPAGTAAGLAIASATDPPADLVTGRKDYTVRFGSAIPLRTDAEGTGDVVAVATFTLAPATTGTIPVTLDPPSARLIGGPGAAVEKSESTADENLLVLDGTLTVGTPEVSDASAGAPPLQVEPSPLPGMLRLTWETVTGATYNVYRGTLASLAAGVYNHACLASGLASPVADVARGPGSFYFLVSAKTAAFGEGSLGRDSAGNLRPNPSPCP